MSMFKTLQNNPGVITIFHNAQSQLSKTLLTNLQRSAKPFHQQESSQHQSLFNKILHGKSDSESKTPREKYLIEEVDSGFPTYDQLKMIKSFVKTHPSSKSTFIDVFPKFIDEKALNSQNTGGKDKYNINISDIKIPDELDTIELINTDYRKLLQDGWFKPPLVIDWDNNLIANNEFTLDRILKHYRAENHSNGD